MTGGKPALWNPVHVCFARRPALMAAVMLIAGIVAGRAVPVEPAIWLGLIAGFCLCAGLSLRRPFLCTLCLLMSFGLIGVTAAQLEEFYFARYDIGLFASDSARLAQVELRIDQTPRIHIPAEQSRPMPPKETVVATVLRIRTQSPGADAHWVDATGKVLVQFDQPHPRMEAGQRFIAVGRLQHPAPPLNPGQFDWAAYYRERRIVATLTVNHVDGVERLESGGPSALEHLRQSVRSLLARGFAVAQSHDFAALRALLLGDRDAEMRDVQDGFSKVGAAHLLAVSGLHVAIVAGFLHLLCRLLRFPPRVSVCVMMGSVFFYGLIVLPATPVLRAVALCLIFGCGMLQRRSVDRLQMLAITCCAMLLYHPLDLYSAGFQLSFGTVFGLLLYAKPLSRFMSSLEDPDMKIARSFRPPTRWELLRLKSHRLVVDYIAFGTIAWLISAPLVAIHFNQINAFAIVSGLVLFPVVILGVIGGILKLVLSLLLPSFSGTWATLSLLPIHGCERLIGWLAKLPGSDIPVAAPPLWLVIGFYMLLALPLLPIPMPNPMRWMRAAPGLAAMAMAITLPFLSGAAPTPTSSGDTRITLLAIGAGQIGVIELPDGQVVLIDDGSSSMNDPLRTCLAPYLRSRGVRSVSTIYLSHPDYDHISATADTALEFGTARVVTNPVFREQSRGNLPAETMLDRLATSHIATPILARGGHVPLDDATSLDVLWPPPNRAIKTTNNAGLVLKLICHGRSILFPADIQVDTERELIQHPAELKSDVLIAPHHGSTEASTADFLRAVDASIIVSSNDRTLSHKQKAFDKLIGDHPLYRTHRCGAISIIISKTGELRVETFLKVEPQWGK